ncbi:MAG: DUF2292 domain-containing protein [Planctomycetota bacterium]
MATRFRPYTPGKEGLTFGEVTIVVQDGVVVQQIERLEKATTIIAYSSLSLHDSRLHSFKFVAVRIDVAVLRVPLVFAGPSALKPCFPRSLALRVRGWLFVEPGISVPRHDQQHRHQHHHREPDDQKRTWLFPGVNPDTNREERTSEPP